MPTPPKIGKLCITRRQGETVIVSTTVGIMKVIVTGFKSSQQPTLLFIADVENFIITREELYTPEKDKFFVPPEV